MTILKKEYEEAMLEIFKNVSYAKSCFDKLPECIKNTDNYGKDFGKNINNSLYYIKRMYKLYGLSE